MSKKILITTLFIMLLFSVSFLSGCGKKTNENFVNLRNNCCQECVSYIHTFDDEKSCLDNPNISDECLNFFEENKDENCLYIASKKDSFTKKSSLKNFEDLYKDKEWAGNIFYKGETQLGPSKLIREYNMSIKKMYVQSDGSINGIMTLDSVSIADLASGENVVEGIPITFKIVGKIYEDENEISFEIDPSDPNYKREFKTFWDLEPEPFRGEDISLGEIIQTTGLTVGSNFKNENNQIIIKDSLSGDGKHYSITEGKLNLSN
ncbi:hypothetical protein JXA05_01895 [Candidatus Peregrinibacteria bacterium]|nr:hypothetical protein [Candidatus Peregrinibacteria bacterium]